MSQFSADTAVTRVDENVWRGDLRKGWRIGAVPNGGYVLAVAGQALRQALGHKDPLSVNAFYLAPTGLGPIDCHVEILREGRNTSHAVVKMYQEGELKVQVTAAYSNLQQQRGENWSRAARPEFTPWEQCQSRSQDPMEIRQRVEMRLVSGGEVFVGAAPDGSGEFTGWAQHADGSAPDVISLLMFADAFPPPVFSLYGPVGWVPTIELTVQVRAHPVPGPLQARLRSRHLTEGVVEEDGEYWDSAGTLVALSRQTAKVRVPAAKV